MASSTSITASDEQVSPLLELPAELRNTIYHLVLAPEDGERMEITLEAIKKRTTILRTSSQIRKEATQIFYATNTFLIRDLLRQERELGRFLKNTGTNTTLIPRLVVHFKLPKLLNHMADITIQAFPNLSGPTLTEWAIAYERVHTVVQDCVQQCGRQLIEAGVHYRDIAIASSDGELTVMALTQKDITKKLEDGFELPFLVAVMVAGGRFLVNKKRRECGVDVGENVLAAAARMEAAFK